MAFYLMSYAMELTYADIVPERLVPWLAFHGVMALVALFALTVLIWARLTSPNGTGGKGDGAEGRAILPSFFNNHHKTIGRITAILWLLTQAGGFINLFILR